MNLSIHDVLSPVEAHSLRANGRDPADFLVLEQTTPDIAVGMGRAPNGETVVMMQATIAIPHSVMPIRPTGILNSDGSQRAEAKLQSGLPMPPTVRVIVARELFNPEVLKQAEEAKKAQEEAAKAAPALTVDSLLGRDGIAHG
jgi:hypothetical protein